MNPQSVFALQQIILASILSILYGPEKINHVSANYTEFFFLIYLALNVVHITFL